MLVRNVLRIAFIAILLILANSILPTLLLAHGLSADNSQSQTPSVNGFSDLNLTQNRPKPLASDNPCRGFAPLIPNVKCGSESVTLLEGTSSAAAPSSSGPIASYTGSPPLVPTSSQSDPPPALITAFDGLNADCTACSDPPDVQVAVGPNHVMEMLNVGYQVYTKTGAPVGGVGSLGTLFQMPPGDLISDPRLLFDPLSGRWFASLTDGTATQHPFFKIIVSSSNDPSTATWYRYLINATCQFTSLSTCVPDQPHIGVSNDKLVVSANIQRTYCPVPYGCITGWDGAQYWALDKRQMTEGASSVDTNDFGIDPNLFSIQPAQSLSSNDPLYMVMAGCTVGCAGTSNTITYVTITGLPPNAGAVKTTLSMAAVNEPPQAVEPGGATVWAANKNDARVQTAVWFNSRLWFALNNGCGGSSGSAYGCIRLVQIYTPGPTLLQGFDFVTANVYYFYPALTIDAMGNMALVYGYSSANLYPSIAMTEQLTSDSPGTLSSSLILVTGTALSNTTRFGDYFGASTDPANSTNVWVAGEYGKANTPLQCGSATCYSTYIAGATTSKFTVSGDISRLDVLRGTSAVQSIALSSVNAYTGQISFAPEATVSVTATNIDDCCQRTFGLLLDQSLDTQFWVTQPGSVLGCCQNPFTYSHTYPLTVGQHFVEFGVSAWVGQWRAQISVNGNPMATIDTDVSHHVHITFQVGGSTLSPTQQTVTPTVSVGPPSQVLQPNGVGSATYIISTNSTTSIMPFVLTVTAAGPYQAASIARIVNVVEFSVTASSYSSSLTLAGSSTSSTITVSSLGYSGGVSLGVSASQPGPVVSLWPHSVTVSNGGSATSTLDLSTGGAGPGNYVVTVSGTSMAPVPGAFYQPGSSDTDLLYTSNSVGQGAGEVFTPTLTGPITSITVLMRRTGGTSVISGHLLPIIYAADGGTYGTDMTGQLPALATGNSFDVTSIPNDYSYHAENLTFTGANQIVLNSGTHYVFILDLTDITTDGTPLSGINLAAHTDGTGYGGNPVSYNSNTNTWTSASNIDVIFQVTTNGGVTHSITIGVTISGDFSLSASPSTLSVKSGKSGTSTLTLTSLSGFSGSITLTNQTSISISASTTDDTSCRSFGLIFDQSLDTQFWLTQPSSVIGTGCNSFPFSHTYSLTPGSHFLEFGVSAWVGHWHAQITVNGVVMASVDSDVYHHVHVPFSVGGVAILPVVANGPNASLSATSRTISPGFPATLTLTVSTTRSTPTGTYTITVTGTSGGLSHAVSITVTVT